MSNPKSKQKFIPENNFANAEHAIAECRKTKAKELNLTGFHLGRLPEGIRELKWLQDLNALGNDLTELPDWIGELTELRSFDLQSNNLQVIPSTIKRLKRLETLWISGGDLSDSYEIIGELTNLSSLMIGRIGLTIVPNWLRKLRNLKKLFLFENNLTELPNWLEELKDLELIWLSENCLKGLPASICNIKKLARLGIRNNPDLNIPTEIVKGENARKILDYYFRNAQPLNEFKLILVGRGVVGKTSLVHRLVKGRFKKFDRTPGINITKWPRKIDGDEVHAHIWDFGGQEIMHGTHRFFMTERALYLVLISGREGTEDYDAEYWLSMVRSFAGDVPVIVLLNKCDDYRFELNRELLREKYGKDIVFVETDSATGNGIPELREQICAHAKKLPGLKASWPAEWRQIKDELPTQKKSWLTFDDFRMFCHNHGITSSKDQEDLAESLHDLGLMLSYRKEEALRSFGVLNPAWVTDGIYKLLNSPQFRDAWGKFTVKSIAEVLPANEYPAKLHPYLLALMRKFQLCHPLDDKGEQYLIPDLLSKNEPLLESEFPPEKCLGFIYSYDTVLPEGLLPRFIVETYVHQEPKFAWRTGVVLERGNCRALIRGDVLGRKIIIRVTGVGNGRRELMGVVREYFERIHRSYELLPVTSLVPVPGHPTVTVPYNELVDYEAAGDDEYKVVIDRKPVKLGVKKLLDGVDLPGAPRNMQKNISELFRLVAGKISGQLAHSLFISYSHKDELYRDELRGALTSYVRKQEIEVWDDTRIEPGQKWEKEILEKLESADIIVLLLSNDFIKSDYCMQDEMKRALERDAAGECVIVPIVVRDCRFDKLEVGKIQAILPNAKPIKKHRDRDAAWLEVTKQLDRVIARLKKSK
ncbi:MAG: COR domain-containing protein [Desulfuromonadaceae bacterium]|nr:COR domain-containing protein [Desulfuromonadaceae bacterium]MDD2847194.1 COR domain-containing protein [Desulfuromonadaceae bacterium]MDD4130138.1 COR domain-containing protein [Desulfuromonadaceae bacterium]